MFRGEGVTQRAQRPHCSISPTIPLPTLPALTVCLHLLLLLGAHDPPQHEHLMLGHEHAQCILWATTTTTVQHIHQVPYLTALPSPVAVCPEDALDADVVHVGNAAVAGAGAVDI